MLGCARVQVFGASTRCAAGVAAGAVVRRAQKGGSKCTFSGQTWIDCDTGPGVTLVSADLLCYSVTPLLRNRGRPQYLTEVPVSATSHRESSSKLGVMITGRRASPAAPPASALETTWPCVHVMLSRCSRPGHGPWAAASDNGGERPARRPEVNRRLLVVLITHVEHPQLLQLRLGQA